MTLIVHALGAYASYGVETCAWRRGDYDINKLVKSLKGDAFPGYADLRDVRGNWHRIEVRDRTPAFAYFSAWAAKRLRTLDLGPFCLVPVPSSQSISYTSDSTPMRMARETQQRLGDPAQVRSWLRFTESMTKSRNGGTRNFDVLFDKLRVSRAAQDGARAVLVDDVKTTGAHLRACAARLREYGVRVDTVVVAAATVWDQVPNPLSVAPVDLELRSAATDDDWDF